MLAPILKQVIEIHPDVSGGKPHIAGHRITVQKIVVLHEVLGLSIDEIANEYDLTLAEIHLALAYYFENKMSIEQSISEEEGFISDLRKRISSKL